MVGFAVERLVKEELMDRLSEFLKSFLVIIVVEEVVFSTYQGFIDAESEVVIGTGMFVSDFDFQVLVLSLFQNIVATLGFGIEVLFMA